MTEYPYSTEDEDDLAEDGRRRRAAELYPADRGFYLSDPTLGPPEPAEGPQDDEPYQDDLAYLGEETATQDAFYAQLEAGGEPLEAIDIPTHEPAPAEPQPANTARMSVAAAGAASDRNIRFDPTQERGPEFFENATRHSRWVRRLKILLPTLAAIGVLGFLAVVQFAPEPGDAVITLSGVNIEDESVTMEKPHISGFEGTRRAYEVRASQAVQDLNNPNIVTMDNIRARLGLGDGETAQIRATKGIYDAASGKLVLEDGITLKTTNGYDATFERATVDIETGRMSSNRPLEIITEQGTVKANGMVLRQDGKHVRFRNGVSVVFTPPADSTDMATPDTAPTEPETNADVEPAT